MADRRPSAPRVATPPRPSHPAAGRPQSPRPAPARPPASPLAAGRRSSDRGQASVELVALLPLVAVLLGIALQFVLAGQAVWHARVAARAAARAHALGEDARAAALAHLPAGLERGLRVRESAGGDVRVSIRIPAVLHAVRPGRATATARFDRQDG